MYATITRLALIFVSVLCSLPLAAHVELDYPTGGESFEAGQSVHIEWHVAIGHEQIDWDLYFSTNGGETWEPLELGIPVDILYYDWTVPNINTTTARIRIVQDNVILDYEDMSFPFTITAAVEPPSISMAAQDITISCGPDQEDEIQDWLDAHGGAGATVHCGDGLWTHNFEGLTNGCGATGNTTVTFTISDNCGNAATTSASVTVEDHMPPEMTTPAQDIFLQCNNGNVEVSIADWLISLGGASATDACGEVMWANNYIAPQDMCEMTNVIDVMFEATDACGNARTTEATLTVEKTTSVAEQDAKQAVVVFPNPVDTELFVRVPGTSHHVTLTLLDNLGRNVLQGVAIEGEATLDMRHLASGIYLLQVDQEGRRVARQILVR